jgi:hypothetical protein
MVDIIVPVALRVKDIYMYDVATHLVVQGPNQKEK